MGYQEILDFLAWLAAWLWGQWQVQVLTGHIVANVVVAVAVSVATGEFVLGKTGEFLYKKILPLVLVYGVFAFVGESLDLAWVALATWGLLETLLLGDLFDNLKRLGISKKIAPLANVPAALTKERLP